MIKKIFTYTLGLFVLATIAASCSKENIVADENDIVGTWTVTAIRSDMAYDWDGDGYTETDIYGTYSYCQRDIQLAFDNYGSGQSRQGCNAYWQNMNWSLTNNNRTLRISLPGDDLNLELVQFNQNIIKGQDLVYVNGRNFTVTYTLQRN
jgi:hypothetical protein